MHPLNTCTFLNICTLSNIYGPITLPLSYSFFLSPSIVLLPPNDLSTQTTHPTQARSKFEKRRYASMQELVGDLHLMFSNCELYNEPESLFGNEARRLRDVVDATVTGLL